MQHLVKEKPYTKLSKVKLIKISLDSVTTMLDQLKA